MADKHTFDISSKIDLQELDNALNQALREIKNRYDLKKSNSKIEFNSKENKLEFESESDYKLDAIKDIFHTHLLKRGISIKALNYETIEKASGERVRQKAGLQQGIPQEKSKEIIKFIKQINTKVQSQIMGDHIRVTSKKIDDLQDIIKQLKSKDFDCAMGFINFK
jgi:cyclic-di-GMP-binding protein